MPVPEIVRRPLFCPKKKKPARVTLELKRGAFGRWEATDTKLCSLFRNKPITCERVCMGNSPFREALVKKSSRNVASARKEIGQVSRRRKGVSPGKKGRNC